MRRRRSSSQEATERMEAAWAEATDWKAVCRKCGARLTGPISVIRAHVCPDAPQKS